MTKCNLSLIGSGKGISVYFNPKSFWYWLEYSTREEDLEKMLKSSLSPFNSFNYAIALTGGIATGKSSASQIFLSLGCEILDADKIAHEVLDSEYKNIAKMFGASMILNDKVNRKALGAVVFDDRVKRQQLEALLHPLIYEDIAKKAQVLDAKKCCYFVDIPLFFENRRYPIKKVLVIAVSQELQLQRLMQRDTTTQEEAQKRIDAQLSIEEKIHNADYVIENTATLTDLKEKCIMMKEKILADFGTYH